ncbi:MAG TPA: D-alanyl-D-alanine carboxypeptidase/D-alanyl-D-alanine-endopeptidase [Candidatus Acidoferrales bacterium]|nr:D-alanyl-D-alanine carboxypeptidase/D-alanyl-D-alanine-endopeptidase [Candidatus Acidoferrales bacterium]
MRTPVRIALACALIGSFAHAARPQTNGSKESSGSRRTAASVPRERKDVAAFRARAEKILSAPEVARGYWGLLVEDAETGEVLFAQNADRYFTPASNAKLFTLALALATLGPDYRFHTTLESRAPISANGALVGDLVLVGRGDPNLSNRQVPYLNKTDRSGTPEQVLAEMADSLIARGVTEITGNIVGDDGYFTGGEYPSGWAIDDMLWSYGAPVSALEVNDGTLFVNILPGTAEGALAEYAVEPWASGLFQFRNEMTTGARGSKPDLRVERNPDSMEFVLSGAIPADAQARSIGLANPAPAEYAAALLKQILEARGVKVYGKAIAQHGATVATTSASACCAPSGLPSNVLVDHVSLPLAEAARVVAKVSQNLHAEMLMRDASREKTGDPTSDAAVKFAEDFRKGIGITEDDVLMSDASGLSRRDLVTPQSVATLLRWADQQSWRDAFHTALPIAGEDGTLSERMLNTLAADHVWAKTGTLGHVESLSGYATSASGQRLVFSFFANNHLMKTKPTEDTLDALAVAMVEEFGKKTAPARKPTKKP